MPYKLTIHFSGLFVFVNRPGQRLAVLAAKTSAAPHHQCRSDTLPPSGAQPHPPHSLKIKVGSGALKPFHGHLDLASLGMQGGNQRVSQGLPMTRATGVQVAKSLYDGKFSAVASKLDGRVALPAPKRVSTGNATADAAVWNDAAGKWEKAKDVVAGVIIVEYEAANAIDIVGETGTNYGRIDQGNSSIWFTHLPPNDNGGVSHPATTCFSHAHMNSPIFNDKAAHFRTISGMAPITANDPSVDKAVEEIFGVDPVVCTAGLGCPDEVPPDECTES